jgi:aldose 1-epimerase
MKLTSTLVCQHQGADVFCFTLSNEKGMHVTLSNYGGIIQSIQVPDKTGNLIDVVLGFDTIQEYWLAEYVQKKSYIGSVIGRYANRIADGKFAIDGKTYHVSTNAGKHQLHGGNMGFDKKVWEVLSSSNREVVLQYLSKNGEEGFPGNILVQIRFKLAEQNELSLTMTAQTDEATPLNLTHHGYFNLEGSGHIGSQVLQIASNYILKQDADFVPTGELKSVKGSAYDFTKSKDIGADWDATMGYDQTFVLNSVDQKAAATVFAPQSGICMEVFTNQPSVHFYSATSLANMKGKNGVYYGPCSGFCLEDQIHPDAVNHAHFPNTILRPGETYTHETRYVFSVRA